MNFKNILIPFVGLCLFALPVVIINVSSAMETARIERWDNFGECGKFVCDNR